MFDKFRKSSLIENFGKGFTMIEVMIVVSITIVMTVVLFEAKKEDNNEREVDAAINQIISELRALQSDALNGKEVEGQTACYFRLGEGSTASSYQVTYYDCTANPSPATEIVSVEAKTSKVVKIDFDDPAKKFVQFASPIAVMDGSSKITAYVGDIVSASIKKYALVSGLGNIESSETGEPLIGSCSTPGGVIASGSSVVGYKSSSVSCGSSCDDPNNKAIKTCANGVLSNSEYINDFCAADPCPCSLGDLSVAVGASVSAFKSASVACAQVCETKTITCLGNDIFSDSTFEFSGCSVESCPVCSSGNYDPAWSACVSDGKGGGTQTKNLVSKNPSNCIGGTVPATISQSCPFTAPVTGIWTAWTASSYYCENNDLTANNFGTICNSIGDTQAGQISCQPDDYQDCNGEPYFCGNYTAKCVGACTSWTYSDWGACQSDGVRYRSVLEYLPTGCVGGGVPVTKESCTYEPPSGSGTWWWFQGSSSYCGNSDASNVAWGRACSPIGKISVGGSISCDPDDNDLCYNGELFHCTVVNDICMETCTSFAYSSWGACLSNSLQYRSVLTRSPAGCAGGAPVTQQSCTYVPPPVCTSWTYGAWSACNFLGLQSRWIASSSPDGCAGGSPIIQQSCSYTPTCFDGVQNGGETGIDCGGVTSGITCSACIVQQPTYVCNCNSSITNTDLTQCDNDCDNDCYDWCS